MATPLEKYKQLRERVDAGKSTSDEFDEFKRMRRFYDQYLDDSGKTMEAANENALNRYANGDLGRRERDYAVRSKLTGQEEQWSPGRRFRQTEERNPDVDEMLTNMGNSSGRKKNLPMKR